MTPPAAIPAPATSGDLDHAAVRLAGARRVLVTGLCGASVGAARAACDLAEVLGAAVDFGQADLDRPAGPTIARVGAITAAAEEMRDRADLVILWDCDPTTAAPAVAALLPQRAVTLRLPPPGTPAFDAARLLQHLLRGGAPPAPGGPGTAACVAARDAIEGASCVAVVTDDSADAVGLVPWAVTHLVREIAHRRPAFEIPLRHAEQEPAAAVCTWRYGAAGAIARADRSGGVFLPGEASARRLVARREIDCVLAIGQVAGSVAAVLAGSGIEVIRFAAEPAILAALRAACDRRVSGGGP